jgi:hypothetical protein
LLVVVGVLRLDAWCSRCLQALVLHIKQQLL